MELNIVNSKPVAKKRKDSWVFLFFSIHSFKQYLLNMNSQSLCLVILAQGCSRCWRCSKKQKSRSLPSWISVQSAPKITRIQDSEQINSTIDYKAESNSSHCVEVNSMSNVCLLCFTELYSAPQEDNIKGKKDMINPCPQ